MSKTAWVFPGQGTQFVGMGRELYEEFPQARALFQAADQAVEYPLTQLCFNGPEAELGETENAQPAILTHSAAVVAVLRGLYPTRLASPHFVAGHSLGEYSALVASGALGFVDAVKLVRARGLAMKRAGEARPGAMAAVIGLEEGKLTEICDLAGGVQLANINAPGQIVISGDKDGLERALQLARQAGAKRVIPLAVSIASHSELMRPAVEQFRQAVDATEFRPPTVPVISNVTAEPLRDETSIREDLLAQLVSPVQWVKSVESMSADGVKEFLELGPKDVLVGLIRRIVPGVQAKAIGNPSTIKALEPQSEEA